MTIFGQNTFPGQEAIDTKFLVYVTCQTVFTAMPPSDKPFPGEAPPAQGRRLRPPSKPVAAGAASTGAANAGLFAPGQGASGVQYPELQSVMAIIGEDIRAAAGPGAEGGQGAGQAGASETGGQYDAYRTAILGIGDEIAEALEQEFGGQESGQKGPGGSGGSGGHSAS
jgi:hypothetical protein